MKIALVQNSPVQGDPGSSLADLDNLIGQGCGADIYVLPEMFATGQYIDPSPVVQTMDGQIVDWMIQKASFLNAAVCGSLPIKENGCTYNRLIFAKPDGTIDYYDKHHLFSYSGESQNYTPGQDRVVIEFRGLRIMLLICYDLRFPTFSRNRDDYDAVFYPANWPDKRILAWDTLLRARAIENQCYAIGVNRAGADDFGFYPGHSAIITPYGETVQEAFKREVMEELGISVPNPTSMGHYVFESKVEKELVNVFKTVYDGPVNPSKDELAGGRFWTMQEIKDALGKDILTPNFESEFRKFFI